MPATPTPDTAAFPGARQDIRAPWLPYAGYAAAVVLVLMASWPEAAMSRHMLLHVFMMAAAAPLVVVFLRRGCGFVWQVRPPRLWMAGTLQLGVFLYWHSPSGMMLAMHAAGGEFLLQFSLLAVACLFWWCIAGVGARHTWHAIAALLCTGKLFCLVALILTFAPRPLYHAMALADQQFAGLIMITLCPLTYVASALWLCRRWLGNLDARSATAPGRAPCA